MSAALKHCGNLSTVSEASANVVRKIFPGLKSKCGNGKRKFDPSEECVIADQKRKKKSTSVRIKPRTFPVVLLRKKTMFVPKGHNRQRLNKDGRIQKVAFRRNMSQDEVTNTILEAFASFELEGIELLRCGQDNLLSVVKDTEMNGDTVFEVAGQGSLYVIASRLKVTVYRLLMNNS